MHPHPSTPLGVESLSDPLATPPWPNRPAPLHAVREALMHEGLISAASPVPIRFVATASGWRPYAWYADKFQTAHGAMAMQRASADLTEGIAEDLARWLAPTAAADMDLAMVLRWHPKTAPLWGLQLTITRLGFGHGDERAIPAAAMDPFGRFLRACAARLPKPDGEPRTPVVVSAADPKGGAPIPLDWLTAHDDPEAAATTALLMLRVKLVGRIDSRLAAWEPTPVPLALDATDPGAGRHAAATLAAIDDAFPAITAAIEDIGDPDDLDAEDIED